MAYIVENELVDNKIIVIIFKRFLNLTLLNPIRNTKYYTFQLGLNILYNTFISVINTYTFMKSFNGMSTV